MCRRPRACFWVGGMLIVYVFLGVALTIIIHLNVVGWITASLMLRTHLMCGAFGMLGSSVAAVRKYYQALITESTARAEGQRSPPVLWDLGWVVYYLTRPILGAILGALSYTMSFVGLSVLATPSKIAISDDGRYLLYALAFLSGFAVSEVLDRLNSVAKEVFKSNIAERKG